VAGRTNYSEGREAIVDEMVASIRQIRDHLGRENLAGIGVVVPGFIRLGDGVIANSNNLADLEGFPIRDRLEDSLETTVILENDANAAALGKNGWAPARMWTTWFF